jgi:hypothetical protein
MRIWSAVRIRMMTMMEKPKGLKANNVNFPVDAPKCCQNYQMKNTKFSVKLNGRRHVVCLNQSYRFMRLRITSYEASFLRNSTVWKKLFWTWLPQFMATRIS